METLSKLFGSESRVKILRLFLFNQGTAFSANEIVERSKTDIYAVKHELKLLRKIGFIKRKAGKKPSAKKPARPNASPTKSFWRGHSGGRTATLDGWALNERFAYLSPMQKLLLDTVFMSDEEIHHRFSGAGKLKLVIVAGVFVQHLDSRLDLLIAGDQLKRYMVEHAVKGLEAEIGKELTYAAFDTQELHYRMGMYDRLLRDVTENPHRALLDKIGFEKKFLEANAKK